MDQDSKDSPANLGSELKRSSCLLGKLKQRLEPVVEASNEFSIEVTDRLQKSMRSSHRPPSPFVVEKFDYSLMIDEDSPRKLELSPRELLSSSVRAKNLPSYLEQNTSDNATEAYPLELEVEIRQNHSIYKTPGKSTKTESTNIVSPGKAGFFSLRKKTNKSDKSDIGEGFLGPTLNFPFPTQPNASKIKIVNNIFQNSILQNMVKPSDGDKKKLSKGLESKGSVRRKSNISVDVRDQQTILQPAQKPKRVLNQLLSPQHKTDRDRFFSFHHMAPTYLSSHKAKKEGGEEDRNPGRSRFLDESSNNTIVVNKKLLLGMTPEGSSKRGSQTELSPAQIEEMRKFHNKLNKLIRDLNCSEYLGEGDDLNLKLQWRFVKDMASKYAEASQKLKMFEAILHP